MLDWILIRELIQQHSGKPFPALSPIFLDNAVPLIAYLKALPEIGPRKFKDLEYAYAEVRSRYVEDALRNCGSEILIDATADLSASAGRRGLGRFLDVLFSLAKVCRSMVS